MTSKNFLEMYVNSDTENSFNKKGNMHPTCFDILNNVTANSKQIMVATNATNWGKGSFVGATNTENSIAKKGESPYIVPFFNFYYYWCLVPFRIVLDQENLYTLKKNKLQQVVCALAHALIILSLLYVIVNCIVSVAESDLAALIPIVLEFLSNLSGTLLVILLVNVFWRKEKKLLEVINCTIISYEKTPLKRMKILKFTVFCTTMWITITGMVVTYFLVTEEGHYMSDTKNSTAKNGSSLEPTVNPVLNSSSGPTGAEDGLMDEIASNAMLGLFMYEFAIYPLSQGMFLMITMGLRQLGKEFEMNLEETFVKFPKSSNMEEERIREGLQLYKKLRSTITAINNLFAGQLLSFCVTNVTYYAETPYVLMEKRGSVEKAMLAYFMQTTFAWLIAAEFHHHVKDVICNWIEVHLESEELKTNTRLRLMTVFNQVSVDPIALQNKYFTVTYNYVCSMLSLIVTYGMLIFQLQQGGGSEDVPIIM